MGGSTSEYAHWEGDGDDEQEVARDAVAVALVPRRPQLRPVHLHSRSLLKPPHPHSHEYITPNSLQVTGRAQVKADNSEVEELEQDHIQGSWCQNATAVWKHGGSSRRACGRHLFRAGGCAHAEGVGGALREDGALRGSRRDRLGVKEHEEGGCVHRRLCRCRASGHVS